MKDEKYRVLKLADLNDARPQRVKQGDDDRWKTWCPECHELHKHRSLQYDLKKGAFHCFYCGLHGRIETEDKASPAAPLLSPQGNAPLLSPCPKGTAGAEAPERGRGDSGDLQLTDYVSLPDAVLDGIADISLDPNERNPHQVAVRRYLEAQQIPLQAARHMRWGVASMHIKVKGEEQGKARDCLVYRNYVDGICCNAKYRTVTAIATTRHRPDGTQEQVVTYEKGFTQESAVTPTAPYNIDSIKGAGQGATLIVCEGEKDCLVLHQVLGYPYVLSVSNGAQTDPAKTFAAFRPWLEPFHRVVICGDQDRPGREMARRMATYFDDREVLVCEWDQRVFGKDITEVYQRRGEDAAKEMLLNACPVQRTDIVDCQADSDIDEICQLGLDTERRDKYSVGIGTLTDRHFMLTPEGGLIIVTGTPNTGKTDFLNFLTTCLMAKRDEGVCFCSFETPNKKRHLARLAQLWIGATEARALTPVQHRSYVQRVVQHAHHLSLRRVRPTAQNILHRAETVLRQDARMRYLVIDPYLYMDVTGGQNITETEAIKHMLTEVQDWAQEHRIWVFIVAHPRKLKKEDGSNELEKIDMYTIAGSANWANIADFILALERVQQDDGRVDYTRLDVLKVREQDVCRPGTLYYLRQLCGRYDECRSVEDCKRRKVEADGEPWEKTMDN